MCVCVSVCVCVCLCELAYVAVFLTLKITAGGKWPGGIITSNVDRFCSSMELSVCSLLVKPKPQSPNMMARCLPLGCFSPAAIIRILYT